MPEGPVFALASHICTVTVTPELLLFATSNSIKIYFLVAGVVYTAVCNPLSAETFVLIALKKLLAIVYSKVLIIFIILESS